MAVGLALPRPPLPRPLAGRRSAVSTRLDRTSSHHALIPCGSKTGADATAVLWQRRDGLAVGVVEGHLQCAEIGLLALRARRLWDRGNAVLIEQPFQRHLRSGRVVLAGDFNERRIGGDAALRQR